MSQGSRKPFGLKWRASSWTITLIVAFSIAVDLLVYSVIIPVAPFQLERLGYSKISALTGWLLFAFSGGLLVSTIPIAVFSERYNMRKTPFIIGVIILLASQAMFMEAPNYSVMCIARLLQGIGSSMVWVVGLALLSDSAPQSLIGSQLGIAITGLSVGVTIGPPVGGALYDRFGFRGPFIFSFIAIALDLGGRLIIIERKDAIRWGYDPAVLPVAEGRQDSEKGCTESAGPSDTTPRPTTIVPGVRPGGEKLSIFVVVLKLVRSPRALTALFVTIVYGIIFSAQEPPIPLHLQRVWDLNSKSIGILWIACAIPTFFSSALAGYWADKGGTEWPTFICLILSMPWWIAIILEYRLALFIASFALEAFFTSGVLSPMTTELANASRNLEGVGFGHVYGAFNLAYGIGSTVGPVIGGQMYAHISKGWMALCLLFVCLLFASLLVTVLFTGDNPLYSRLKSRLSFSSN